jgi:hypothetical protein
VDKVIDLAKQYGIPMVIAGMLAMLLVMQSRAQEKQDSANAAVLQRQIDLTREIIEGYDICKKEK